MKRKFIVPIVVMSLLLAGCTDNSTKKPRVYAPYSALKKDEDSLLSNNSSEFQGEVVSEPIDGVENANSYENSILSSSDSESRVVLETQASPISDFEYETNDLGEITITKYIGQASIIIIPSEINGKPVSELDHKVFYDCADITDITIPDSILTIGIFVFNGCNNLQNINVSDNNINFSSKGGVLFNKDGSSLIQFPCGRSGEYSIPSGTDIIGEWAFQECNQLLSVTIPDSVTTLDDGAFYKCSRLKSVKGGKNVSKIPPGTFGFCKSLSEIDLNDNLKAIEFDAFTDCKSLSRVTFPDSLSEMGERAIDGCSKIHVTYKGKTYNYYEREQLRQAVNRNQNVYSSIQQLPINQSQPYESNGHTTTAKDPMDYQGSFSVPQAQDNSQAIYELNQEINTYKEEISEYQGWISELNNAISELDNIQAECEDNLKKANIELANAQKKKVYPYDGSEFKQVPDEGAVAKAQEKVDTYKGLVSECETSKEEARNQISQCESKISARETAIAICQAQIDELS